MNIEKIYIVVVHQVDDFAELVLSTKPFLSSDKAKEYFNSIVEDERNYVNKKDWEIETDTDTCFCAFEDGKYSENHSFVELREEEIHTIMEDLTEKVINDVTYLVDKNDKICYVKEEKKQGIIVK